VRIVANGMLHPHRDKEPSGDGPREWLFAWPDLMPRYGAALRGEATYGRSYEDVLTPSASSSRAVRCTPCFAPVRGNGVLKAALRGDDLAC